MRTRYGNDLPFSTKLAENIDDLKERIGDGKASLMIIDGGVGEGKTTLAVHVADYYQGSPISLKEQLALGGLDFTTKLRTAHNKGHQVVIYDEAGDFNRRGALTRFNANINRIFETFRAFRILVILVLPSFHVIDTDLFDKNIPRLLVHCHSRKKAYGRFTGYSLNRMLYLKHYMGKMVVKAQAYQTTHGNFHGEFLDLPEARRKALDKISTAGKFATLKGSEISMEGLTSYYDLSRKVGRSVQWVKQKIKERKIKYKRIIDRKKYFDNDVIDLLADEIKGAK